MAIGALREFDDTNQAICSTQYQTLKKFITCSAIIAMVSIAAFMFPAGSEAAGPWKGQIVEKKTGTPLEGVVVLAVWERHLRGGGTHGSLGGYGASEEVVTDNFGYFTIEARSSWTLNPFVYLKGPRFYIFKPGYGRWQFQGEDAWSKDTFERQDQQKKAWEQFEGDGVVLELPALRNREERHEFLSRVSAIGHVPEEKIPKYLDAINKERIWLGFDPIGRIKNEEKQ